MQNIKATGNKFLVEMKNDQGEYELLGVLSLHEAVQMQFTTHHAIRMQRVCNIDERDELVGYQYERDELVGHQLFTKGELRNALRTLRNIVLTKEKEGLEHFDLRNGYSTSETRDLCENQWGEFPLGMDGKYDGDIESTITEIPSIITDGNLEVYYNDYVLNQAEPVEHGIWIKDGKITKVY